MTYPKDWFLTMIITGHATSSNITDNYILQYNRIEIFKKANEQKQNDDDDYRPFN